MNQFIVRADQLMTVMIGDRSIEVAPETEGNFCGSAGAQLMGGPENLNSDLFLPGTAVSFSL